MVEEMETLNITILGKNYQLKCEEEKIESLLKAVDILKGKISQVGNSNNTASNEKLAVLTGLYLIFETVLKEKEENQQLNQLEYRVGGISEKLAKALHSFD